MPCDRVLNAKSGISAVRWFVTPLHGHDREHPHAIIPFDGSTRPLSTPIPCTAHHSEGLSGSFVIPGDKSISHRALMLSSLAMGESAIAGLLESDDVLATASAMRAFGAQIERQADGRWLVYGPGTGALAEPDGDIDFGNSGTGVRLAMGIASSHPITTRFTGDHSLCGRPMGRILDPMREIGARIDAATHDRLPLTITGARDPMPITYRLPMPSAQVKSAVLLAGLNVPGRTQVIEPEATRDHTERMLRHFGAILNIETTDEGRLITLEGETELRPGVVTVPADPSSAAFAIVAALITADSDITLPGVMMNATRRGLVDTLIEMGASIEITNARDENGEPLGDLRVRSSRLHGVTVPAERAPSMIDEYPVLAAAAAFAEGPTHMKGLDELRVKESDRLAAVADGLTACGVDYQAGENDLIVTGSARVRGGGTVETHFDHRIAMAFLVLGLGAQNPVKVDDIAMIATSFPEFIPLMTGAGARLEAFEEGRS